MNEIEWHDDARDQLADIWVAATELERVEFEVEILRLERLLVKDPHSVGESRTGSTRVVFVLPLVFWFSVGPSGVRIVRVMRVRRR